MDIRPQDLPELRAELVDFCLRVSPERMQEANKLYGGVTVPWGGLEFYAREQNREGAALALAELFYVTAEMSELAQAAGRSLPPFTLAVEDLPSAAGLVFFGSPLTLDTKPGACPTWAATWRPNLNRDGINITWYIEGRVFGDAAGAVDDGGLIAQGFRQGPRLATTGDAQAPFGGDGEFGEGHQGEPFNDARRSWLNTLKAAWLLMQQPLATISEVEADRAARKRLRRINQEPASVRVIELRRPKHSGSEPGESSREYHHRWITRGHWRQQWYATRQVHRPVWIAPHVKGPEGAPMIGGEKVYAWKR